MIGAMPPKIPTRPHVLGYCRVSTEDQALHGASLPAQADALTAEAERRGWDLEFVTDEGLSAKNLNRPGLLSALERLDAGEAHMLAAVRLDRVSRSVHDFSGLLDRAARKGWAIVFLDVSVDTSTPSGEFVATTLAASAQFERKLIGQRTREGLARRRAEGVVLGRPRAMPTETVQLIVQLRAEGLSLSKIADTLNDRQVPTAHGGKQWYVNTIKRVLDREQATA